jgi:hypothetical protein
MLADRHFSRMSLGGSRDLPEECSATAKAQMRPPRRRSIGHLTSIDKLHEVQRCLQQDSDLSRVMNAQERSRDGCERYERAGLCPLGNTCRPESDTDTACTMSSLHADCAYVHPPTLSNTKTLVQRPGGCSLGQAYCTGRPVVIGLMSIFRQTDSRVWSRV